MLYPRTISITRPTKTSAEGALSYGGRTQGNETSVASGVRANIQARREGQKNPTGLPGDGTKATWRIFTPRNALLAGQVKDGDLVTDDLGRRFQVTSDYVHNLGCTFYAERLEA